MQAHKKIISRRQFLNQATALIAAVGLPYLAQCQKNEQKPNFIIIFADDLGYGDIEGFGPKELSYKTPHLKQMADEGVKLKNFYVPLPYCAPSRATILTGRYPFHHGMVYNTAPDAGINDLGLALYEITIADKLKENGYATSCVGKWHLGHKPEYLPTRRGFDEYYGILYSNDMRPVQLVENEKVAEYPVIQSQITHKYTQRALSFIERCHQNQKHFFLYLPHAMPHKPLAASESYYTPDTKNDLYADVIRELDWSVGQILQKLKDLGIDENTFVVFTSDNGPWYGGSTGGLRGMKGRSWDGGLRVPLIARWPGKIPGGIVNASLCGTIDIFPTLLNLADVKVPTDRVIDGKNLWSVLTSEKEKSLHDAIFGMKGQKLAMIRSGKWKLHFEKPGNPPDLVDDWIDPRRPDGVTMIAPFEQYQPINYPGVLGGAEPQELMLFDLENDPAEQQNIAAQNPKIVKQLKKYAAKILQDMPKFTPPKRYKKLRRIQGGTMDFYKHHK